MDSIYLFPMIYEFLIFGVVGSFSILLAFRFFQKKTTVIKYIFLYVFVFSLSALISAISRVLRYTGAWLLSSEPEKYLELLAVSVCFIALSNIFLLMFGLEIFQSDLANKKKNAILLLYWILTITFIIFALVTGLNTVDLTTGIWGFLIGQSLIVDLFIIISCFNLINKMDDPIDKIFVRFIALSPISIIMIFVFFFLDRIMINDFTIFYYLGWIGGIVSAGVVYIGIIRPSFIENYFQKRNKK
ncbi:hypothetical protein DSAG12_01925 [Promethearchaeum syntrophicum]|uniref:Histidine kinase N-terminal 7TM region domain-containing protein n=1 Tax=Promethearchaeum syntrophicum TaxID=2594042 RepID=A0A5B9DB82_9ARCH|nr:hypothetical protein [Candidatus Prometheoarchaeum syntrophicum]